MKKIILFLLVSLSYGVGHAQPTGTVYFTFTSKQVTDWREQTEGIYRDIDYSESPAYKGPTIFFTMRSVSRGIYITFAYLDFNLDQLAKYRKVHWDDSPEIRVEPKSFLNTVTVQDLNQILQSKDRKALQDWVDTLEDKKIFFIDKNDETSDSVKLIQVVFLGDGRYTY